MSAWDTVRREILINRYSGWLEYYGVPRAQRRIECADLRANLDQAVAADGYRAAADHLGHPRDLARAVGEGYAAGPRWVLGLYALLAVVVVQGWSLFLTMTSFAAGAEASGVTGREVSGGAFPWPDATFTYEQTGETLAISVEWPWFLVLPLLVWVLAARPWRLLTRRRRSARLAATRVD